MSDEQAIETPRWQLARGAREHYQEISNAAMWSTSIIPEAIDVWEKYPSVLDMLAVEHARAASLGLELEAAMGLLGECAGMLESVWLQFASWQGPDNVTHYDTMGLSTLEDVEELRPRVDAMLAAGQAKRAAAVDAAGTLEKP